MHSYQRQERIKTMEDRFKLRVWDNVVKKYLTDDDVFEITDGILDNLYDLLNEDNRRFILGLHDLVFEQCTGCRDCSNQLIYEGDILEIAEDMGTSHVVVRWDNEFQKWTVEGDTEADYEFYDLVKRPCDIDEMIDDIGVVGNIHENPELLEKK